MARNKNLLQKRNKRLQKRFETLCKAHPHWRMDYIIDVLSDEFCLSARTIENILKR